MKKLGFNLVLLGEPASGKETQANILKNKYSIKFVETGVYTRKFLKKKGPDGDWARRTAGKGKPLPVPLLKEFLIKNINNHPKGKDLLFLGGPRLKPEAQLLKKMLDAKKQDYFVLYITLPEKEVYIRSIKRKADKKVKALYKVFDTEKIIKTRLEYYKKQVSKTEKYFESLGKLKKINGNQSIERVAEDIEKAIQKYQNK
ncbi:MAG: nucleoside monophosphate kinase [bacterium]